MKFEGSCILSGRPILSVAKGSEMRIGDHVEIHSTVRSNPLACFQPSVLRTLNPTARLILGKRVGMAATAICAGVSIEIGEGTIIGSGAMILDNDFHVLDGRQWRYETSSNARPVKIGSNVFIGARAIVLKGVTVGDFAVIGAGAVVTHDVPPNYMAIGNPAKCMPRR